MGGGGGGVGDWCWWPRLLGSSIMVRSLDMGLLLDIDLLVDHLGYRRSNRILIGRSWWRLAWCYFPRSMGYPLVWEIWISIAQEFSFYLYRSGDRFGQSWDRLGDLEFYRDLDREIGIVTVSSIRRLWRIRVWFGFSRLVSSSGNSIGGGISRAIRSSIGRSGAWSIGGTLGYLPVGILLGILIWKIVLDKGLVLLDSPSGFDWGIVKIQIDTTVESIYPRYKRSY